MVGGGWGRVGWKHTCFHYVSAKFELKLQWVSSYCSLKHIQFFVFTIEHYNSVIPEELELNAFTALTQILLRLNEITYVSTLPTPTHPQPLFNLQSKHKRVRMLSLTWALLNFSLTEIVGGRWCAWSECNQIGQYCYYSLAAE